MSLLDLPKELWRYMVQESFLEESYVIVLRNVSRVFAATFDDLWLRSNPLVTFASNGHVSLVKWDQEGPARSLLTTEVLANAVESGVELLRYLLDRGCPVDSTALYLASQYADVSVVKFLADRGSPVIEDTIFNLARRGDLELLLSMPRGKGGVLSSQALLGACRGGHLEMVKILMEQHSQLFSAPHLELVCELGDLKLLKYLYYIPGSGMIDWKPRACMAASSYGHVHILEFLASQGHVMDPEECLARAVLGKRMNVLEWFADKGHTPSSKRPARLHLHWIIAAQYREHAFLEFGLKYGVPLIPEFLEAAIHARNHAMVHKLLALKCPMNDSVLVAALTYDKNLADRLRALGLSWTTQASAAVARQGNLGLLQTLVQHKCPVDGSAVTAATELGHVKVVQYLHEELGLPLGQEVYVKAVLHASLPVLRYFHAKNGDTATSVLPSGCYVYLNIPLFRQLLKMGVQLNDSHAVEAGRVGNLDLLRWIIGKLNHNLEDLVKLYGMIAKAPTASTALQHALKWFEDYIRAKFPEADVDALLAPHMHDLYSMDNEVIEEEEEDPRLRLFDAL